MGVHPEPSGRVAAATLQRLVGSLTESLRNLGPKLRIDGAASWRRDIRANCGAIAASHCHSPHGPAGWFCEKLCGCSLAAKLQVCM